MPDAETDAGAGADAPRCPACGALADGRRVSHLRFSRDTPSWRYVLLYAEPCGCLLEAEQYAALMRRLHPRH